MTYDEALEKIVENINDLLNIRVGFLSVDSYLSDFLWGDTPENRALAEQLGLRLGVSVKRNDPITAIARRMSEEK